MERKKCMKRNLNNTWDSDESRSPELLFFVFRDLKGYSDEAYKTEASDQISHGT